VDDHLVITDVEKGSVAAEDVRAFFFWQLIVFNRNCFFVLHGSEAWLSALCG
jgi:hypothetical protein